MRRRQYSKKEEESRQVTVGGEIVDTEGNLKLLNFHVKAKKDTHGFTLPTGSSWPCCIGPLD